MNVRKGASLVQGEVHSPFPRRMGEFLYIVMCIR